MRIVHTCFRGLYADNPRALYEGMLRRGIDATHVWMCTPATEGTFPPGVVTVRYPTPDSAAALESADVVIANDCISQVWTKKPGAVYLQTWHGTPLKRIHHDVRHERPGWLDKPDLDVARWDHLLSPNPASTPRLIGAFRYRGPVHETGYPRNDALLGPGRDRIRAETRARLGIADGTTAVLYAPTWRDDLVFDHAGPQDFEVPIDLEEFDRRLGRDHVLLVRLHSIVSGRLKVPPGLAVVDVTDEPDSAAMYLAADALVTDYSSAMFDFAVTGKPLLFYRYDLAHYRDDLRGFYFDLAAVAPGPSVTSSDGLLDAVADLASGTAAYAERYSRFRETFTSLEDGHATDRVLDLLFPPGGASAGRHHTERG